jgi:phosphomannomutase
MNLKTLTLREALDHSPVQLAFGTSGRRGKVADLSQLEIYINVVSEMRFLLGLPQIEGGISPGDTIYIGYDLRPSSVKVLQAEGRGGLLQAIVAAIYDSGLSVINLGIVPTPALTTVALSHKAASIMITGSHIPFDRNGYKLNTAVGELRKSHESPINELVAATRAEIYADDSEISHFDEHGMLRSTPAISPVRDDLVDAYVQRYRSVFGSECLAGLTVLFYEHSSAGREVLPRVFQSLGATVICRGRSDMFVPVDTENLQPEMLKVMQEFADEVRSSGTTLDAVISADGDADRPLLMALEDDQLRFVPGDMLGMLAAELLEPDAVVVPVSCNDAVDRGPLASALRPKTRIGSPFVIEGMETARKLGAKRTCGWEPNGGFLLGSDLELDGHVLHALPTRDAALPLIAALLLSKVRGQTLAALLDTLPSRFGATALLKEIPRLTAKTFLSSVTPVTDGQIPTTLDALLIPAVIPDIESVDLTDGVRVISSTGSIVHLRPSGNADEFRIYAVADSPDVAHLVAQSASQAVAAAVLNHEDLIRTPMPLISV